MTYYETLNVVGALIYVNTCSCIRAQYNGVKAIAFPSDCDIQS